MLEEGSKLDPLNCKIRLHLEKATQSVLHDLLTGASSTSCHQNPDCCELQQIKIVMVAVFQTSRHALHLNKFVKVWGTKS